MTKESEGGTLIAKRFRLSRLLRTQRRGFCSAHPRWAIFSDSSETLLPSTTVRAMSRFHRRSGKCRISSDVELYYEHLQAEKKEWVPDLVGIHGLTANLHSWDALG